MSKQSRTKFFDFIILTVILIIITSISYPLYKNHITSTQRSEAKIALFNLVGAMERYYATNKTYKTATLNKNKDTDIAKYSLASGELYTFQIISQSDTDFTLQATPTGTQAENDLQCGNLKISKFGEKSISGSGPLHKCW